MVARLRPLPLFALLAAILALLAMVRPIDHDESQYVAAASLTAQGLLPWRDYAYLQTPLQPFVLAPLAWVAGEWTWPVLRLFNALLAAVAVAATWRAMRMTGVGTRTAFACAALFATTDILLFSAGTARNDALPAALFALALLPMLRGTRTAGTAALAGALLAAAAAAKISYALPAVAYGVHALIDRSHRPAWLLAGAAPVAALVAVLCALDPFAAYFGVLLFPSAAPFEYYAATGRLWKMSVAAKAVDSVKFLALGPALLALGIVARRTRRPALLDWLILASLLAALLPSPTWRQYLLPLLPPLFIRLAQIWQRHPPGRTVRAACVLFAAAGLIPTMLAVGRSGGMIAAVGEGRALRQAMDAAGIAGPVATLSPQFIPATGRSIDPRFAAGPFYFRSHGLVPRDREAALHLVSRDTLYARLATPPGAIVVGGEGKWTSGDPALDTLLEAWALRNGWRRVPLRSDRLRLYIP